MDLFKSGMGKYGDTSSWDMIIDTLTPNVDIFIKILKWRH